MERWVCKQCCDSHRAGSCSWQGEEGHDALLSGRMLARGWQRAAKQGGRGGQRGRCSLALLGGSELGPSPDAKQPLKMH